MKQYLDLIKTIQEKGTYKPASRSGMPGTQSYFGYQYRHDLSEGFPLLTTKKISWKGVVYELLWFLRGDTNIKYLDENGVNYMWHEDAYNFYCKHAKDNNAEVNSILRDNGNNTLSMFTFDEFCKKITDTPRELLPKYNDYQLGDCGFQYGKTWRDFGGKIFKISHTRFDRNDQPYEDITSCYQIGTDQIKKLINNLKNAPESRRHLVSSIDPANDDNLALYWCHAMFQFNCRPLTTQEWTNQLIDTDMDLEEAEKLLPKYYLDCQIYQRSADTVLGVPYNAASYALLTHILAKVCNMIPGDFIHTFGDVHLYDNHKEAVEENLKRTPTKLPTLRILDEDGAWEHIKNVNVGDFSILDHTYFALDNYHPLPAIKAELSTGMKK